MSAPGLADWTRGEPRLVVVRCDRCGTRWYLPRAHCPECASRDTTAAPAAGTGLCVAVTRLHVRASDAGDALPLGLALVELDEGPLVMGRLHDDALAPGDRARVAFVHDAPAADRPEDRPRQLLIPSFGREGSR